MNESNHKIKDSEIIVSEEKAQIAFDRSCKKAKRIWNDQAAIEKLLLRLEKKLKGLPVLGDSLSYIPAMGSLLRSFICGEYKDIPVGTIVAVIGAVLYFVSPIDAIPDFIPGAGLLDDAAVVAICLTLVKSDIDEYLEWRDHTGKSKDVL